MAQFVCLAFLLTFKDDSPWLPGVPCLANHFSNTLSVFCLFVISYVRVNLVSICPSWPEMLVCFWPFKCLMLILGFLSSKYCLDGEHYLFSEL